VSRQISAHGEGGRYNQLSDRPPALVQHPAHALGVRRLTRVLAQPQAGQPFAEEVFDPRVLI
jgi:hypothetical protein